MLNQYRMGALGKRGKTPGTQVQHDLPLNDTMAEIRHGCGGGKRNEARFNITCPDFCPSYVSEWRIYVSLSATLLFGFR